MTFDIAIIGGGPAGYTAAERAADGGLKVVLFEKQELGGVCLNVGCIPTKTLLNSAKYLDHARTATKYGVKIDGAITADYADMMQRKDKVVKQLVGGISYRMSSSGIEVVKEVATILGEDGDNFVLSTQSGNKYKATYLLLSTGSHAFVPPIKGVERGDYWTSTEALSSTEQPESLVVIGGGVVGMEFASFFNSLGSKVHVVEMMPEILGAMEQETSTALRKSYQKLGIDFYLETKVIELLPDGVVIEANGETKTLKAAKTLISVGRKPNTEGLGLETIGIKMERNGVAVNEYMQTSHPRVYAAGDITGHSMLAHTAIREAEVAIKHLLGGKDRMSYLAVPGVVYTNPEVASVGYTEEQMKESGRYYRIIKLPMQYSGRYVAENETSDGFFKLILDEEERLIGAHMIGNPASEIIYGLGIAIEDRETLESMQRHIFPHPTVAEIIHEAVH